VLSITFLNYHLQYYPSILYCVTNAVEKGGGVKLDDNQLPRAEVNRRFAGTADGTAYDTATLLPFFSDPDRHRILSRCSRLIFHPLQR
jgi:hypothetical protein